MVIPIKSADRNCIIYCPLIFYVLKRNYTSKKYPQYKKISTQNKINFVDGLITEMSECLVYGLYVIFNSTLYDEYYRILNGSTQVNSTEINAMPIPDLDSIQEMGRKLMKSKDMSENNCNMILEGYCG